MKKIKILAYTLFLLFVCSTVYGLEMERTKEISWKTNGYYYTNAENYKIGEDYIYTEYIDSENKTLKVSRVTSDGTEIWSQSIENNKYYSHNILLLDNEIYFTTQSNGTYVLSAEDGKIVRENKELFGTDIQVFNENIMIFGSDSINIVSKDLKPIYSLENTSIFEETNEVWFDLNYIENNQIYVLSYREDKNETFILTLDDKLKVTKNVTITYDNNQGFLSNNGFFEEYYSFIKYGGNFYQIGYDMYEISPTGETTLIVDSYELDPNDNYRTVFDAEIINGYLTTVESIYNNNTDLSQVVISIFNKNFKKVSSKYVTNKSNSSYAWPNNITFDNDNIFIRWTDDYVGINNYITEYKIVKSEPSCQVITGDGTNIGDEIVCGTEHFYVLENDGTDVKMLSKYNLLAGKVFDYIKFDETQASWNDAYNYFQTNYSDKYSYSNLLQNEDKEYYAAIVYSSINESIIKQDEKAIGAHGEIRGVPEFPEYGGFVGSDLDDDLYYAYQNNPTYGAGGYIDFELQSTSDILTTINGYGEYLNSLGLTEAELNLITVSEIDALTKNITGQNLPLEKWVTEWETEDNIREGYDSTYIIGSLKDYIPTEYSWLWGTTYWTRTEAGSSVKDYYGTLYFVDTWGDICSAYFCEVEVGAGIRPVVTIPTSEIKYNVITKTDENGTITPSATTEQSGNEITFEVIPNDGYIIKEIRVTDQNGNVITFTDYKFTMPNADVLIEATFMKEEPNPPTSAFNVMVLIVFSIVSVLLALKFKKRLTWLK